MESEDVKVAPYGRVIEKFSSSSVHPSINQLNHGNRSSPSRDAINRLDVRVAGEKNPCLRSRRCVLLTYLLMISTLLTYEHLGESYEDKDEGLALDIIIIIIIIIII